MRNTGKRSTIHRSVIILSLFLSMLMTIILLSPVISDLFLKENPSSWSILRASRIDRGNYLYLYYLGLDALFNIRTYDPRKAVSWFREVLKRYPLHFYSWYCLARAHYELNEKDEGNFLFDKMLGVLTINDELAWNSGVFLFAQGERERGGKFLRKYLMLNPGGLKDVLDLSYRLDIGINSVLSDVLDNRPEYYEALVRYLINRKEFDDLEYVWKVVPHESFGRPLKLALCDSAIRESRHELARSIWGDLSIHRTREDGVKNGNFEYDIAGGCYGWIVGRAEGMRTDVDRDFSVSGMKSFTVWFDGEHNPGIAILRQTIPVSGGNVYGLNAYIRTKDITTTNGLFFAVDGAGCRMKAVRTEQFTGTNRWRVVKVEFEVPEECTAVAVTFMRVKSRKFNNKIGGRAWVDTVAITRTE